MTISRPSRADAVALGLIATGAVSVAIAALVSIALNAIDIFGASPALRMPVYDVPASELDSLAGISHVEYVTAIITFDAVPAGARWLLLLEGAFPALATIGVCAVAWWLGVSLIRSHPFRRSMAWTLGTAAMLVMVGGMLGQMCGAIGRSILVDALTVADATASDHLALFQLDLDLAPLGWGLALALIAGAFQIGGRLQRDTEGLI